MTLFVCQNLFYSEDGGTGEVVTLSGTAAENKKPEDANSAAGIILVGRAWVFRSVPSQPLGLNRVQQQYLRE